MMGFPESSTKPELVLKELREIASKDLDPNSKRMFGHTYDTGLEEVKEVARKAFLMFLDKTMLDFTVYPSVLELEREVVRMSASLVGGDDSIIGAFTYGGTESIMLAVKAARDYYKKKGKRLKLILPVTGHPAFVKAAEYLEVSLVKVPVDNETFKVDIEAVKEEVDSEAVMIVGSAPNYPMGVIDDIGALSDIAVDKKAWLHVDACIGGFLLPFLREVGDDIPKFGFELPGVTSLSMDLHKYGYAPRGASVVLYRGEEYRLNHIFVHPKWPGYPIVNMAVLSTRSAGPLAASWLVLKSLGREGYQRLAEKVLYARKRIIEALSSMDFRVLGDPRGGIVAFTTGKISPTALASSMRKRGWYIQVQPGSRKLGLPKSIHLTISPAHADVLDNFLRDLEEAKREVEESGGISPEEVASLAGLIESSSVDEVLALLGVSGRGGGLSDDVLSIIDELIHYLDPDLVEELLRRAVSKLFT
ncbi:MAG: aspartate aminotransferase family protein [Desulfurococcales archaeon]|nr:aspartate aminotransferase family protein [Desulfurococcales archaeon]